MVKQRISFRTEKKSETTEHVCALVFTLWYFYKKEMIDNTEPCTLLSASLLELSIRTKYMLLLC